MSNQPVCPRCGKPLPPNAPQGLCPECLLQAGFASRTMPPPGDPAAQPAGGFEPPTPAELGPFFPQLEILACVGRGGMGAVYRARQPALDRVVALKILPPHLAEVPGFAERFTREARALAKLTHPNIVAVHDFGRAGRYHYLLMEFVDGVNLRHLLNAGAITPKEALAIVPPICDALQFAHDRGVVHRDIKPENILISKDGGVKIADFGLARIVGLESSVALTGAGAVMGTPHYMAPEQVERPAEVDHRADIYAVGVVFYQMLTGELPLGRFDPPSRKVHIDVRLDEIVLRALEHEPSRRYQNATGFKTDVQSVATTPPPAAVPGRADSAEGAGKGAAPVAASGAAAETNARAEGKYVVVPVAGARLPLRCVKTNVSVTPDDVRRIRTEWFHPVIWLSLLMTPVAFLILYLLFRTQIVLNVPESAAARTRRRKSMVLMFGMVSASVGAIIGGLASHGGAMPLGVAELLVIAGVFLLPVAFVCGLRAAPPLRLVRCDQGEAWLIGAGPEFLASLPGGTKTQATARPGGRLAMRVGVVVGVVILAVGAVVVLVRPAPQASAPAEPPGYEPVVQVTVGAIGRRKAPELLSFSTGQLKFQSEVVGPMNAKKMADVLRIFREHGIDATGTLDPNTRGLAGWELCALPIDASAFRTLNATALVRTLEGCQPGSPVAVPGTGKLPATYAFKTRNGRVGLLQILGFAQNPPGVKIRYKLVKPDAGTRPVPVAQVGSVGL